MAKPLRITVLGATGHFGEALVARIAARQAAAPGSIVVAALTADMNIDRLVNAAALVRPELAVCADETAFRHLRDRLIGSGASPGAGDKAMLAAAVLPADLVVVVIPGMASLPLLQTAMLPGRRVVLAERTALAAMAVPLRALAVERGCQFDIADPLLTPLSAWLPNVDAPASQLLLPHPPGFRDTAALWFAATGALSWPSDAIAWQPDTADGTARVVPGNSDGRTVTPLEAAPLAEWILSGLPYPRDTAATTPGAIAAPSLGPVADLTAALHQSAVQGGAVPAVVVAGFDLARAHQLEDDATAPYIRALLAHPRLAGAAAMRDLQQFAVVDFEARATAHQLLSSAEWR